MNKRIACLGLCIFVLSAVYYNESANRKSSCIPNFRYVPTASTYESLPSCATGVPCTYSDVVDLRVIVITFNRPDSLSKLLRSLDTLVLDGDRAALEIWIDRDRKNAVHKRTLEVAKAFNWKRGTTRVHVQVAFYCFALSLH